MPFCSNCGLQHKNGSKFCTNCGTKIELSEQAGAQIYEKTVYSRFDDSDKSLQTLSKFLIILLYIRIVSGVIELLWAMFKWKSYVASFGTDDYSSPLSSMLALVFISFFFVRYVWIYKASKICNEKYDNMEYTPFMAIAWFFIPVANLFMPFLVLKDLCKNNYNIAKDSCFWWYIFYLFECVAFTLIMATLDGSAKAIAKASIFWTFTSCLSCYCFARIVSGMSSENRQI